MSALKAMPENLIYKDNFENQPVFMSEGRKPDLRCGCKVHRQLSGNRALRTDGALWPMGEIEPFLQPLGRGAELLPEINALL